MIGCDNNHLSKEHKAQLDNGKRIYMGDTD